MKLQLTSILIIILATPIHTAYAGKCDKYKDKLNKIQSQQRQANTVKQSNKLKEREQKAFKLWRLCQQGKLKK